MYTSSENSELTGAIFLDLTKGFDIVDYYLLLDKLYSIGVSQNSLLWFNSYLHNRRQCVHFNGNNSDYAILMKEVPQGSSLGPLLFSIFINDLPKICSNCQVHLYADDAVIYSSSANKSIIENTLQREFASVQRWFSSNKLILNKKKSCCMFFGTRSGLGDASDLTISFTDGSPLTQVTSFKYLGLWIDPSLSFEFHIESIINKLSRNLAILCCSINCFTLQIRKRIVTQLLLPILDYADIVY